MDREQPSDRARKRRVTDIYFQRLTSDTTSPPTAPLLPQHKGNRPDRRASFDTKGIPLIRATTSEEEISDSVKSKASPKPQDPKPQDVSQSNTSSAPKSVGSGEDSKAAKSTKPSDPLRIRRFHLTRDLSSRSRIDSTGRISKNTSRIRPPLPTFVERIQTALADGTGSIYLQSPIDRIIQSPKETSHDAAHVLGDAQTQETPPTSQTISTFIKPAPTTKKLGKSVNDHPSTWDIHSDQLANELAALAIEMDQDSTSAELEESSPRARPDPSTSRPSTRDSQDGYVYDTYIRVDLNNDQAGCDLQEDEANVGLLVIDEEDQDLWEEYIMSDEDEDWDEEDSNGKSLDGGNFNETDILEAEDNPVNDYPEEELDSDDEFDHGAYQHRQNGSDEEQWDENDDFN